MTVTITYDGATPTIGGDEDAWGPILNGAFDEIKADLDALASQGNTDTGRLDTAEGEIDALQANLVHTGDLKFGLYTSAPAGWVKANGGTIGNASSGGTTRANADTEALFALIWTNTAVADLPIQDSAGGASTKGASAAADYAANKRITLPDMRAMFLRGLDDGRGVDTSRAMASYQADQNKAHVHQITPPTASGEGGSGASTTGSLGGGESISPYNSGSEGGADARPRNIAALAVIKL